MSGDRNRSRPRSTITAVAMTALAVVPRVSEAVRRSFVNVLTKTTGTWVGSADRIPANPPPPASERASGPLIESGAAGDR